MDSQILITEYSEKDQHGVKQLVLRVLKEFGFGHNPELDADLENPKKYYKDTGGVFFVLKNNNIVAGTVAVIKHQNGRGEIKRMYVDKSLRGRAYGAKLLDQAILFYRD